MFKKQKKLLNSRRSRQASPRLEASFRRNSLVTSRSQREVAARQQSVMQRQLDLKRGLERRKRRWRLIIGSVVAVGCFVVWQQRIAATTLEVGRPYRVPAEAAAEYQLSLQRLYQEHTIAGQAWLLDRPALSAAMQRAHPEVARAKLTISSSIPTKLRMRLEFRRPAFIWQDVSKNQQFVDRRGVLFGRNFDRTLDTAKLIRIEDESGVVLEEGNSVLTQGLVTFVGRLHGELPTLYGNKRVARVVIPRATREVQAQMADVPYLIKFSSSRSFEEQIGELRTILSYLQPQNITPTQYIDVRVSNKAFYK